MGAALSIWAFKKLDQETILLNIVKAAYRAKCGFYLYTVNEYTIDGKTGIYPYSFTLRDDTPDDQSMIFHIGTIEDQIPRTKDMQYFCNINGESIYLDDPVCLAVSEDVNTKMSFYFTYEYLNIMRDHVIRIDFLIDWPLMQEIYAKGYSETWCWRPRDW
jgi:hypothetical protein